MREILKQHYLDFPKAELQDYFKLIHQSEFGPGHFIKNSADNFKYLLKEFEELKTNNNLTFEVLSPSLCRLHLDVLRNTDLEAFTLQRFFEISAKEKMGNVADYNQKIFELKQLCIEGILPFTKDEVENFILEKDIDPETNLFRHSATYRELYSPSYRVVKKVFCDLLPLFTRIDELMKQQPHVVIAIDGDCASGKSSLSKIIQEVYDCNIIQMDDFFLQANQRTKERLDMPGGNIDFERLLDEVFPHLKSGASFSYRPFNCMTMDFDTSILLQPKKLTVVEGSYSQLPILAEYYDLKIFLSIPSELQLKRILYRNGPALYERFKNTWIPMEKKYAAAFDIKAKSDFQFDYLDY